MCATTNLKFHNTIAKLCLERFQGLPKRGKPNEHEWTILSCIVLEKSDKLEVVALGTGTKCIGRDKMSKEGDIVNDSHAEVICRRAFLRYIYEKILSQKNDVVTFNGETQKFQLSDCKVHFFTTHIPCGDAAIFPKQDIEEFGDLISDVCQNSLKRHGDVIEEVEQKKIKLEDTKNDIFRTGAKCLETDVKQDLQLEGASYHVTGVVRTKPGRGVPTLSVSCSDKLSKWCHLGVQGALLSILFSSPIYFNSFTISGGTHYSEESLRRALFSRLENIQLQTPYHRSDTIFGQADLTFEYAKAEGKDPCPSSIIWINLEHIPRQMEVAVDGRRQGVTKKQIQSAGALQISRKELFKKFLQVIQQLGIKLEIDRKLTDLTYIDAKLCSQSYQKSWLTLKKSFKVWTRKESSLMEFCVKE